MQKTILTLIITGDNIRLTIDKKHNLEKGDFIQIYLPATQKFLFVKKKKTISNGIHLEETDQKIKPKKNPLKNIERLNISVSAKEIVGKNAEVIDWGLNQEEGYILDVIIDEKEYEIYLNEAIWANEVRLVK